MDYHRIWYGYLTAELVKRSLELAMVNCPACNDGQISPLFHVHQQLGLKEKIDQYLEEIQIDMCVSMTLIFKDFTTKMNCVLEEKEFTDKGCFFVSSSTSDSFYYGRFLTEDMDQLIHGIPTLQKNMKNGIKRKKYNTTLISKNDASGRGALLD